MPPKQIKTRGDPRDINDPTTVRVAFPKQYGRSAISAAGGAGGILDARLRVQLQAQLARAQSEHDVKIAPSPGCIYTFATTERVISRFAKAACTCGMEMHMPECASRIDNPAARGRRPDS